MPRKKTYVLDTNVLIHDPAALYNFEDNTIVVPFPVLEELDKLKSRADSQGKNQREVIRELEKIQSGSDLAKGVKLPTGGILKVALFDERLVEANSFDNRILKYVLVLQRSFKNLIFVTKDINLRIKARLFGIQQEDYLTDKTETLPQAIKEIQTDESTIAEMLACGYLLEKPEFQNQFFVISTDNDADGYLGVGKEDKIYLLYYKGTPITTQTYKLVGQFDYKKDIRPRNLEQFFQLWALKDPDIQLVSLIGPAGTGKTLLSVAQGLQSNKPLIITRPTVPVGRDIGFLPGDIEDKMNPWMQAIYDNVELIKDVLGFNDEQFKDHFDIEIGVLTYIRGRSIPNRFMVIDEAQNLTPHEIKTLLTRVGEDTKVVLTGDPSQIDVPYLDQKSNGLVYVTDKFVNEPEFQFVELSCVERSSLQAKQAKLL